MGSRRATDFSRSPRKCERVAVSDVDDTSVSAVWAMTDEDADPMQHPSDLELEKCLLYVAAAQARDGLYLT